MKKIAMLLAFTRAGSSFAHEGHGLTGSHWHASDTLGYLVLAVAAAAAVWLMRGGK